MEVTRRNLNVNDILARLRSLCEGLGEFETLKAEGCVDALEAQLHEAQEKMDDYQGHLCIALGNPVGIEFIQAARDTRKKLADNNKAWQEVMSIKDQTIGILREQLRLAEEARCSKCGGPKLKEGERLAKIRKPIMQPCFRLEDELEDELEESSNGD
jgi:hypothetical protein